VDVVRKLLRAGYQRFDAGELLYREHGRTLDGVYLAGYCIECCLKVLILRLLPVRARSSFVAEEFRGQVAHDFEWLHSRYRQLSGRRLPTRIHERIREARLVWSTALRYETGTGDLDDEDAVALIATARDLFQWTRESVA
jgi:hypothetical protein